MAISATLTSNIKTTDKGTTQLTLTVSATDMSSKVFAVQVLPKSADKTTTQYRFSHVCSPAELNQFPCDVPGDNCYFRINEMTMYFDDSNTAALVIKHTKADIKLLVDEYKALQTAQTTTESTTFN